MSWVTYSCSETFKTPLRFSERCGVTRGFPHFRTELAKQWCRREAGKCTYIFMRPTPLAGNYCYRCIYISRAPGIYCRCLISLVYEFYWRELVTRLHRSTETGATSGILKLRFTVVGQKPFVKVFIWRTAFTTLCKSWPRGRIGELCYTVLRGERRA